MSRREADLNRVTATLSFLSSLVSFFVLCGGGAALLVVQNSGERATGALLAFCGAVAFASVLVLLFAPEASFREQTWRAGAVAAAIIGAMPVGGLAAAAFRFAGFPFRSAMPSVDWSIFLAGVALALGALSILALGYRRARTAPDREFEEDEDDGDLDMEVIHMKQIRDAQLHLRSALESAAADARDAGDDEVRVRRV